MPHVPYVVGTWEKLLPWLRVGPVVRLFCSQRLNWCTMLVEHGRAAFWLSQCAQDLQSKSTSLNLSSGQDRFVCVGHVVIGTIRELPRENGKVQFSLPGSTSMQPTSPNT